MENFHTVIAPENMAADVTESYILSCTFEEKN
jgi:hypothetical protein